NPIPSALVGIGLAWLWVNRRGEYGRGGGRYGDAYQEPRRRDAMYRRYRGDEGSINLRQGGEESWDRATESTRNMATRAGEAVSGMAGQVQETASNLAGKAKETVTGAVGQAQQTASYVVDQAQSRARRVEQRFNAAMEESP